MKRLLVITFLLSSWISFSAQGSTSFCSSASGNYCQYTGKVSKVYVNSNGFILMYFESPIATSEAQNAGFTIQSGSAAVFQMSENIEFAKMFYATALAAQASGRDVTIQMHDVEIGYLKFSRIWLSAP